MTATRTRKQTKQYKRHQKYVEPPGDGCVFCKITSKSHQFVEQSGSFKVIRNIFPYSLWDNQPVQDHLLVIPAQHTDTLADITPKAAQEFVSLISKYESRGYSLYARPPQSVMKSLTHQHTHLIKLQDRKIRGLLFIHKPYIRILIK